MTKLRSSTVGWWSRLKKHPHLCVLSVTDIVFRTRPRQWQKLCCVMQGALASFSTWSHPMRRLLRSWRMCLNQTILLRWVLPTIGLNENDSTAARAQIKAFRGQLETNMRGGWMLTNSNQGGSNLEMKRQTLFQPGLAGWIRDEAKTGYLFPFSSAFTRFDRSSHMYSVSAKNDVSALTSGCSLLHGYGHGGTASAPLPGKSGDQAQWWHNVCGKWTYDVHQGVSGCFAAALLTAHTDETCFCQSLLLRGATLSLYIHIYENYRIYDLPWDSPWTWIIAAIGCDFAYYWIHRAAHGKKPL